MKVKTISRYCPFKLIMFQGELPAHEGVAALLLLRVPGLAAHGGGGGAGQGHSAVSHPPRY
jgi:hypothetical protein